MARLPKIDTRSVRRATIHHVYYLLAAFNILAIVAGLALTHHINGVLAQSVRNHFDWSVLYDEVSQLRVDAGLVNKPGNDVFESKNAAREQARFSEAAFAFRARIAHLKGEIEMRAGPHASVKGNLDALDASMSQMVDQARLLLEMYARGDIDGAGAQMAGMDRSYSDFLKHAELLAQELRGLENASGLQDFSGTKQLQNLERAFALVVALMVVSLTFYGRKLGKLYQRQYDEAALANSKLAARTVELQSANERITDLNSALGRTIQEFKETQAEMVRKEEMILQSERFNTALNQLPVGLSMFDAEHRLITCNSVYRRIYGVPEDVAQPGTSFEALILHYVRKEGLNQDAVEALGEWSKEHFSKLAQGKPFSDVQMLGNGQVIELKVGPMADGGWVDVLEDITEQRRQEARIEHMAHHDALTDLPNRVALQQHLEHLLMGARGQRRFAVHFLDLDGFKGVNDMFGHASGDALLKQVTERLKACIREGDLIARLGGDEFAIVQAEAVEAKDAQVLASRILGSISAPYDLDGQQVAIGTSVGIALSPHDGNDAAMLLQNADLALYQSKKRGRRSFSFYDPAMSVLAQTRFELERDLRVAIERDQLELFYQPLVDAHMGDLKGFEALLRWRHPIRGLLPPAEFLALAEETGLSVAIGTWVLRKACAQAQAWPKHLTMAVNVSSAQLRQPGFAETVVLALADSGLSPHRLEIEITEWALVESTGPTLETLRKLRDFGVRLALDDFGTGYSSLNYLRTFPVDKIKIDRSFVADLPNGGNVSAIVQSMADLGHMLGVTICAEGVETDEQLVQLKAMGFSEVQGFLVSRPMPASAVAQTYLLARTDSGVDGLNSYSLLG